MAEDNVQDTVQENQETQVENKQESPSNPSLLQEVMAKKDKAADRILHLFEIAESGLRQQWEFINQKGYDFSNDNQLTATEKKSLEQQGMPTFTINRIAPVVDMLNFYATANIPRWQAVGSEGSDTEVAAVFSDMADYIWHLSDGASLYSNCINDSITKGMGFLVATIDRNKDDGMGEVVCNNQSPLMYMSTQKVAICYLEMLHL